MAETPTYEGIAIIGMAGRFPGAGDVGAFWENLVAGEESISRFTEGELECSYARKHSLGKNPDYVLARPIVEDADLFAASFFGITPKDAELMDPQHRIFLECCWQAFEDAGYDPEECGGIVGVFGGQSLNTYLLSNLASDRDFITALVGQYQVGGYNVVLGNDKDYLATRVSYKLNLSGPSVTVQSACSTSLVAVVQACQSLLTYQSDLALAGGVSITFPQKRGYLYQEGGMVSSDGHCRAFDAKADGTVFGSGAGVVLLKRLDEAVADGDHIYAVIKGSAINNDGSQKVGYTAPSVDRQAEVIAAAQEFAGIDPRTVGYVETHGTGTPLGDPIEFAALTKAFRRSTVDEGFCGIGSVKTNVGHLEIASGVTGLIKAALALNREVIPPTLHYTTPNPDLHLEGSPFFVVDKLTPWNKGESPRRAGVSSFGVGGTNAHVVLEEAPEIETSRSRPGQLLVLSAKSEDALEAAAANLRDFLGKEVKPDLADLAYTLKTGRRRFEYRRAYVCSGIDDAVEALDPANSKRSISGRGGASSPNVVFVFPGQGTQKVNMGRGLYESEPVFRSEVDRCSEILLPHLGFDLREVLYPSNESVEEASARLDRTSVTQPAIFVIEYALAKLWQSWGVEPNAMIGHSVGEYAAACLAGVFSLEDALALLAARGRLTEELPGGSMLAVRLSDKELREYLSEGVSIASVNAPKLCVASGPDNKIAELRSKLEQDSVAARLLNTSHAFHSAMIDPILPKFVDLFEGIGLKAPEKRYVSTLTGTWVKAGEATDPEYWARHFREPVLFAAGAQELLEDPDAIFLEVGAGQTLSRLLRQMSGSSGQQVVGSLSDEGSPDSDGEALLNAVGRLWVEGVDIDWEGYYGNERRAKVSLPTYPFERESYWVEPGSGEASENSERREPSMVSRTGGSLPAEVSETDTLQEVRNMKGSDRRGVVAEALKGLFHEMSGIDTADLDESATFLELGFDSLFLTQASQAIKAKFGASVAFRQMLDELSTLETLSEYVDENLPDDSPFAAGPVNSPEPQPSSVSNDAIAAKDVEPSSQGLKIVPEDGSIENVIKLQLEAMSRLAEQQLAQLRAGGFAASRDASDRPAQALSEVSDGSEKRRIKAPEKRVSDKARKESKPFSPFKPVERGRGGSLTTRQQAALDDLIARYAARTRKSKAMTQDHRRVLADPRAVAGFRAQWKELIFPIIVERSSGSKIWDVDGNEYVDMLNGFGVTMFGHTPEFVNEAVNEQLLKGYEIGPMSHLAGEVAGLVCELTGNERATFCNTGSEAVQGAIRLARTVTGRKLVATFAGDYHGGFDEVLIKANNLDGYLGTAPVTPGVPPESVENMLVLEYGTPEALEIIREHADELAAVLVEPVQSRHPELVPVDFLKEVREITKNSGTALIFDEVVTGFRCHPGGAQALFGIRADLVTYGKVAGGGLPIGIISGKSEFMDALDGGSWAFGDRSVPEVGVTFYAGTFFRHPLALAAARAALLHLREQGPSLQSDLTEKTERLVRRINDCFERNYLPVRIESFSSVFYLQFPPEERFGSLFYFLLREKGVHLLEGYPCFLTTAHSEEDLDLVARAFEESVASMQEYGFFPEPAETGQHTAVSEPVDGGFRKIPLTEAQKEIWNACQLGEDAARAYNDSIIVRIKGDLDPEALNSALAEIFNRHEALRTTFDAAGEHQLIAPNGSVEVATVDIASVSEPEKSAKLDELLVSEARRLFDLAEGPLTSVHLVRLDEDLYNLVFVAHHIVCDGWSFAVLLSELGDLYRAASRGERAEIPEAPLFSDFVKWDAETMFGEKGAAAEEYWLDQFSAPPTPLELPYDRPRPSNKTFSASVESFILDERLYQDLKKLGAKNGATLFSTLLAGFNLLLSRLSGQKDIVVAVPAAGQAIIGEERLVGHCANLLPIRSEVSSDESFADYLGCVKRSVLDAYENQNYTYGLLVRKLALPRDPSRLPLLSAMFNIDRSGFKGLDFGGLDVDVVTNRKAFATFDIYFNMLETDTGVLIDCEYNSDLFDATTIRRWLGHFRTLLEGAVSDPDVPVSRLPLISAEEREQQLVAWNDTDKDYPDGKSVAELFEEQAETTPDAVAVETADGTITYRDLDERANRLGNYLVAKGVGQGSLVGICVERSVDMVVGLLGVLKAGAAYVPLDPDYPTDRIGSVIGDSGLETIVTQAHLAFDLRELAEHVVCIDLEWNKIAAHSGERPSVNRSAEDLAYVIYTSGSTGAPKGVQIEHSALVNLLLSMKDEPGIGTDDVLVAVTTLSFDIAGLEIYLPLISGARVAIADREVAADGNALKALLAEKNATMMQATPATWRLLIEAGWEGDDSFKILCGGEALPRDLANELVPRCGELWNMYGPTETTIWSSVCRIGSSSGPVYLGSPIANTQFYVLDENLEPLPVGVPGELHIGGKGLARGYLHQSELTGEKFVRNPFGEGGSERIYKTGDLVRRLADGNIEFLGRIDHQVKVRGYRIELGEIENELAAHPSVSEVVVTAREDEPGNKRLVAYLVSDAEGGLQADELGDENSYWKKQWDVLYSTAIAEEKDWGSVSEDPTLKVVQWTEDVIDPEAEMREWIDPVIERLSELKPKSVLEIGCGSGLLLFGLAPNCTRYVGTDYSDIVLANLEERIKSSPIDRNKIELLCRPADDPEGLDEKSFDLVIIHSVAQYFPNMDYLEKVISGAVRLAGPGGKIFVGDVQNLALLETFHTESIISRAEDSLPVGELQQRVSKRLELESELTVDPEYFHTFADRMPEIGYVDVQLRRGRLDNEPTKYHYDVMITVGEVPVAGEIVERVKWVKGGLDLSGLEKKLRRDSPEVVCIDGIPNARIFAQVEQQKLLRGAAGISDVRELRAAVESSGTGVHPEDIWEMAESAGYRAELRWTDDPSDGRFDLVLYRNNVRWPGIPYRRAGGHKRISDYGNNPANRLAGKNLVSELRKHLSRRLPDYMLPAAFVMIDRMPLTPNGKVDRKALPAPDSSTFTSARDYDPPTNDQEAALAEIWSKVLRIEKVGINDDIFEIGGDSLLIFQIVTRAAQAGLPLKPKQVFEHRTVAGIVRAISGESEILSPAEVPAIMRARREEIRYEQPSSNGSRTN
ncbi:MAG: amino acid adenylation domain-containing protein [Acidobacteriota bacterium]|nr:MAG: amino acid adenylation domain-containing protein [Acidobacteriota bacterium]